MKVRTGSLLLLLTYSAAASALGGHASAQVGTAIAVVGGGLAVDNAGDEFRESIDHARAAATSLLGLADDIAKAWFEQIDEIVNRTISDTIDKTQEAVTAILEDATKKLNALETKIMADVKEVIWQAECSGKRLVIDDLGTALGDLGRLIGTNRIQITPPVRVLQTPAWYTGCFWRCDPYVVDVVQPFGETYDDIRDLMEGAIAPDQVDDDTPADNLVGTYEYLSALAKRTSCFYQGSEDRYNRAYIYYQTQARKWNSILDVPL